MLYFHVRGHEIEINGEKGNVSGRSCDVKSFASFMEYNWLSRSLHTCRRHL